VLYRAEQAPVLGQQERTDTGKAQFAGQKMIYAWLSSCKKSQRFESVNALLLQFVFCHISALLVNR
jgi:hypothetical protein